MSHQVSSRSFIKVALVLLTVGLGFLAFSSGCQKNPVVPPDTLQSDTTSHNFTWTIDTLGDGNSSVLNDVAIINDHLAYAVGEIYLKDSTGQFDPERYNIAKWDGENWVLGRATVNFRGSNVTLPLEGIFAFSESQIWLVGSLPIYGNGVNWTVYDLRTTLDPGISVSKAWGSNSSNMYFVGLQGSIAHYDGSSWQKIESGTTLPIDDIWGSGTEILAVASNKYLNQGKRLLRIFSAGADSLSDNGLTWSLSGIWFEQNTDYWIVGDGVHVRNSDSSWERHLNDFAHTYSNAIRGQAPNDIAIAGDFAEIDHYNGSTWKTYPGNPSDQLLSVAINGNMIIAVGTRYSNATTRYAVCYIGMRK